MPQELAPVPVVVVAGGQQQVHSAGALPAAAPVEGQLQAAATTPSALYYIYYQRIVLIGCLQRSGGRGARGWGGADQTRLANPSSKACLYKLHTVIQKYDKPMSCGFIEAPAGGFHSCVHAKMAWKQNSLQTSRVQGKGPAGLYQP